MAEVKQYLDLVGLKKYDELLKGYIGEQLGDSAHVTEISGAAVDADGKVTLSYKVAGDETAKTFVVDLSSYEERIDNAEAAIVAIANSYVKKVVGTADQIDVAPVAGTGEVTISLNEKVVASLAKADTAVQTVTKATSVENYVTLTVVDGDDATVAIDDSSLKTKIEAVEAAIAGKNVAAEGDAYVEATAADNKVTVKASDSTKASLALADSAVQSIEVVNSDHVSATVADKTDDGKIVITLADTAAAASDFNALKDRVDTFFDIEPGQAEAIKDTLKEISDYITSDAQVSEDFAVVKANYVGTIGNGDGEYVDVNFTKGENAYTVAIDETALKTKIGEIEQAIADVNTSVETKNVSAEGEEGYIDASAEANKVTVAMAAEAKAKLDNAVQNVTTAEGAYVVATKGDDNVVTIDETALKTKIEAIDAEIASFVRIDESEIEALFA